MVEIQNKPDTEPVEDGSRRIYSAISYGAGFAASVEHRERMYVHL